MTTQKRPITVEDLLRIIDLEDPQVSPNEHWIAYVQRTLHEAENEYRTNIWLAATDSSALVQLTRSNKDTQPRWSPDGSTLAFTSARAGKPQIHLISVGAPGGEARALTTIANGAHSPAWSPDGTKIAFLSESSAEERAAEGSATPAPDKTEDDRFDPWFVERIPYRDGYGKSLLDGRFQQLYVVEARDGAEPRRLTDTNADYSAPEWTADSTALISFRPAEPDADEPSRWDTLYRIDVETGAETAIKTDEFANRSGVASADGRWLAYVRVPHEKLYTKISQLAVMPSGSGYEQQLATTLDRTVLDPKWSPDGKAVYFRAHVDGNTEVYRAVLDNGSHEKVVSAAPGDFIEVQGYSVGKSGGIAYVGSTPTRPGELFWRGAGSESAVQLTHVNAALLEELEVQPANELRYAAALDGASVQGWYLLPVNYEAGKAHPLIIHVHGGPRIMANPASKMWHEWQLYAANGFVVYYCNAHGSDGYGQTYQNHAYGDDFADHMAGIDLLVERGIADPERLAVTGGSYGGYMTAWIVSHTDRFKVGLAERGVYNLLSHYGTTDFPMPTPQEFDAEPWEAPMLLWDKSPLAHAHKIKTPLMILHSENDYRVLVSEAEQLFSYMRLSGGTVQMVRFPREGHNLSRTGEPKHRVRRLHIMLDWFTRYIFPPENA